MKKATIYLQTIIMFMMVAFSFQAYSVEPQLNCPSGYDNYNGGETLKIRGSSCSSYSYESIPNGQYCLQTTSTCSSGAIRIIYPSFSNYITCPSNSTKVGSSCQCNTGYAENSEGTSCVLDENNNGIPDDDEENCDTNKRRFEYKSEEGDNPFLDACFNGCSYTPSGNQDCHTYPSSTSPNQVYCENEYTGTGQGCTAGEGQSPFTPEQPKELDCTSVGMVNNSTNDGCISPESPACPENYVDTITDGCQPMTCPVCTFWSEVGGNNGGGGCIQNDACQEPIQDNDNDGIPNKTDPDIDGDGVPNGSDPDVDGDGIPNSRDPDIDGDGIPNGNDSDIDGDGQSNSVDSDKDGDGIPNEEDEQDGGEGEAGDCEAEPEKCELLTNIKDSLEVDEETQAKINELENGLGADFDTVEDDAIFEMSAMFDTFIEDNALLNAYRDLLPTSPWDDFFNADQSCTIETSMQGHEMNFSICQYQPTIRPILGWMMFVITFFAIFALVFERPQT